MSDNDVAEEQEQGPEEPGPAPSEPQTPAAGHPRSHEPFIPPGPASTKDLRERARRRRDAEEKLQQHLLNAKEKPAEG